MANTIVTITLSGGSSSGPVAWDDVTDKPTVFPPDPAMIPNSVSEISFPQTWVIPGDVSVPSGDTNLIPPLLMSVLSGKTAVLKGVRHKISSGTSVTYKIQKNGTDITGYTAMTVNTSNQKVVTDVPLVDTDILQPVVTAVSGSPKNMSISLIMEYGG